MSDDMISRQAAMDTIGEVPDYNDGMVFQALSNAQRNVALLSAVDAVPVVRCKDCEYWKTGTGVTLSKRVRVCTYHIGHRYAKRDDDFCSRGKRKGG